MSGVVLKNVTKRFATRSMGDVTAVSRLDLEIRNGECFSLLGPSGCGKTTTLRMIAGFEDLSEGEIWIGDRPVSVRDRNLYVQPEDRGLGMVFQAFAVWPHLNVFENVAFPLRVRKVPRAEMESRVGEALGHTGLSGLERSFPSSLSGGQLQRIALARAIVMKPDVLLLDEPLSNLDPKLRETMRFEIKALQRRLGFTIIYVTHDQAAMRFEIKALQRRLGFTIIYVTHDQAEAMALSDRMLVMDMGVVQQVDTPANMYKDPANKFVYGFLGLSNFIDVNISGGKAYPVGTDGAPLPFPVPSDFGESAATVASRPNEIELSAEGGYRVEVKSRIFLGDYTEYRVDAGDQEVRIQTAREHGFSVGDRVGLNFGKVRWYPRDDGASDAERERRKVI
ncbi:MAG: sn-glycerol-3-phosphate import ATP-binding protein UgpC [Synergistetes bacterium ADurb.BinA166]|nr:MAG: sn-glycerol-3-phosphate import ATP-binding protein UgpC [Synergistetes bacterium ADurb.BinA166]